VTDDFNPSEKAIKIQGGVLYLQVKDRMIWARREHPDLRVETDCIRLDEKIAVFKATVGFALDEESYHREVFGTGHGSETPQGFPPGYIEKAETVAIGRALAALGYGTAAAFEEQEGGKLADAPVQRTPAPSIAQRVRQPRPTPAEAAQRPVTPDVGRAVQQGMTEGVTASQLKAIADLWGKTYGETDIGKRLQADFSVESTDMLSAQQGAVLIQALSKEWSLTRATA
jgi:hypothetical protein